MKENLVLHNLEDQAIDPSQQPESNGKSRMTRRTVLAGGAAAATLGMLGGWELAQAQSDTSSPCSDVPITPTASRPAPNNDSYVASAPETELAFRCYGFHEEFTNLDTTPLGNHYLLIHFDIPQLSATNYSVAVGGRVKNPKVITLNQLKAMPNVTQSVTLECAGTGRHLLDPRPVYVPWFKNAIGTYTYVGTPLAPILQAAGIFNDAIEVIFTGWDHGVDVGVQMAFERSMPLADAMHPEVMLAWQANGQDLLPQHGFPLRLIVPSWYGMASVKWLRAITVSDDAFQGVQVSEQYRYKTSASDPGTPVREKRVNSVMTPPGIPDLISRFRFLAPGSYTITGKAWSGMGSITSVEFSSDNGQTFRPATIRRPFSDANAWVAWSAPWAPTAGQYTLRCRATDSAGNTQPLLANTIFNYQGNAINAADSIPVTVQSGIGTGLDRVPSNWSAVLPGAVVPQNVDSDDINQVA